MKTCKHVHSNRACSIGPPSKHVYSNGAYTIGPPCKFVDSISCQCFPYGPPIIIINCRIYWIDCAPCRVCMRL